MNDTERVQLLDKLLIRVRANAEARPPLGMLSFQGSEAPFLDRPVVDEREDELKAWPAAVERTSFPDPPEMTDDEGRAIARRIEDIVPRRPSSRPPHGDGPLGIAERGVRSRLEADRWSVLLEDDDAPMATFASELPPPPKNPNIEEKWRDIEPEGALERAVQNAARERASERGAIWVDLVSELRERRGPTSRPTDVEPAQASVSGAALSSDLEADARAEGSPPPLSASGEASMQDADTSAPPSTVDASSELEAASALVPDVVDDEPQSDDFPLSARPTAPPVARSVTPESSRAREGRLTHDTLRPDAWPARQTPPPDLRRSAPPSSLLPPSRRLRRRAQRWSYAKRLVTPRSGKMSSAARAIALVAAVGIIAVVIAVAWFRNPPSSSATLSPKKPDTTVSLGSVAPPTGSSPAPVGSAPVAVVPSSATPFPSASVIEGGLSPEEGAPSDTAQLPEAQGYLYVSSPHKIPVYLNGGMAGETLRWLRVGCGWRYLRLARRGSPPVGSSFPVWATAGRSVLVPCRGATRVDLAEDP